MNAAHKKKIIHGELVIGNVRTLSFGPLPNVKVPRKF
jgi:hypothetical protein